MAEMPRNCCFDKLQEGKNFFSIGTKIMSSARETDVWPGNPGTLRKIVQPTERMRSNKISPIGMASVKI